MLREHSGATRASTALETPALQTDELIAEKERLDRRHRALEGYAAAMQRDNARLQEELNMMQLARSLDAMNTATLLRSYEDRFGAIQKALDACANQVQGKVGAADVDVMIDAALKPIREQLSDLSYNVKV